MRHGLPLLIIALTVAAPAGAQQSPRYSIPAPGAAREGPALRSAIEADGQPAAGAEARSRPPSAPTPVTPNFFPPPAAGAAAGQCRLTCDRGYYFCLSGDDGTDCPGAWGQCRAGCDRPD
jgi:hypothetical protein